MKIAKLVILISLLLQLGALNVFAQGAGIEWDTLNQEVLRLYRAGKYERAIIVAQEVLKVAEDNVGPNHPDVATSLNNLASLYRGTDRSEEAKKLEERAARIKAIKR